MVGFLAGPGPRELIDKRQARADQGWSCWREISRPPPSSLQNSQCDVNQMELTWLADIPQSRSRTRAPRACPACQRRKVRGDRSYDTGNTNFFF